jgi:hypothetical protein
MARRSRIKEAKTMIEHILNVLRALYVLLLNWLPVKA